MAIPYRAQRQARLAHCARAFSAALLMLAAVVWAAPLLAKPKSHTPVCGVLAVDTTWTADNLYEVNNCYVEVPSGVTLTIQPGTVVKFAGAASGSSNSGSSYLQVSGTLVAEGTAGAPIMFTSLADDSRGGDSNENGASSGTPGDWRGLNLVAGSVTRLQHFVVAYAGSYAFTSTASTTRGRGQIEATEVAELSLRDGLITDGASKGLYLRGAGITPVVANVSFQSNHDPTNSRTTRGDAIYQYAINMQPSYSGLSFSGNDQNGVVIDQFDGELSQDVTLAGVPYFTDCSYTLCIMDVPATRTLRVLAGASFDFNSVDGITVQAGGSLLVEGTQLAPVAFGSSKVTADQFSRWNGLLAKTGSMVRMSHCSVGHSRDGNYGRGGLEIQTADAVVSDCRIHDNLNSGLWVYNPGNTPLSGIVLQNLLIENNGADGLRVGTQYRASLVEFTFTESVIRNNTGHGLYFHHGGDGPQLRPTLRNLQVSGNGGDGLHFALYDTNPVLDALQITGNTGNAVTWYCNGSIIATGLVASGNGYDGILLPDCDLSSGRQWDMSAAGLPVRVAGNIDIGSGGFLSLAPGTTLNFAAASSRIYALDGVLFALGTDSAPIVFRSEAGTPGSWVGIQAFGNTAGIYLRHCELRDANIGAAISYAMGSAMVQNCDVHGNNTGLEVRFNATAIRNNSLRDNVNFGVASGSGALVDARGNWWGDVSGPFHASNPAGLGNPVSNSVLFDPWLREPPSASEVPGGVAVATGAPDRVSPGQTAEYGLQYLNLEPQTLTDALLVLQLPRAAEYVSSTGGGVYWPERDQVVWKLGDLAPGASGGVSAQLTFAWGLPRDYRDGTLTLFSAANYGSDISAADRVEYLARVDSSVQGRTLIAGSGSTFRGNNPALQPAYDAAIAAGYSFIAAADVQRGTGTARVAVMVNNARRAVRLLSIASSRVFVYDIDGQQIGMQTSDGGAAIALDTGVQTLSGIFAEGASAAKAECTENRCMVNCYGQLAGLTYLGKKAGKILAWTAFSFLGGSGVPGVVWEVGSLGIDIVQCYTDCDADPQSHCCTAGQTKWTNGAASQLLTMCMKQTCTAAGTWTPIPSGKTCVTGQRCVASVGGPGCVDCDERLSKAVDAASLKLALLERGAADLCKASLGGKPRCKDLELLLAKDPNDIRGVDGDVFPGQQLSYTIRYENEGEGTAYSVYVLNTLPAEFDESSLVLDNGTPADLSDDGLYLPAERQIYWLVGELGPNGAVDSEGSRTYSVRLRTGLASGTVVANQAVVYFPSVPEETPTNTWVNLVAPLAAIPQQLSTDYGTILPITLTGREISGLPLSFSIVEQPSRGTLSGTPPNLVYTPADGMVGTDSLRFRVSNGVSSSRDATVAVEVRSAGDSDPPLIIAVSPEDGAAQVAAPTVGTETPLGLVYPPHITLAVSEPLDATTVTTQRLRLLRDGIAVEVLVEFDAALAQLSLRPRVALQPGASYRIEVLAGITDLAGNPLAAGQWNFVTASDIIFRNGFEAPPLQ